MTLSEIAYELTVQVARPLVTIASPVSAKLRAGVQGRRGAAERLIDWARTRDHERPLVWMHAPSVGESLMAQAVIAELRNLIDGVQIVFTHFSPSAERVSERVGADLHGYLPWDTRSNGHRIVQALKPGAIAFVRTEIWPALLHTAADAGVRLAMINAVLSAQSSRLTGMSRLVLGPAYRRLDAVGAITRADADRFPRLGVEQDRIRVTGDARFDQVYARVQALDSNNPLLARLRDEKRTTLVAGSTWSTDEAELIPAFAAARKGCPLRLIIAPHEPDNAHLRGLENRLDAAGLKHARLGAIEATQDLLPEVVVVDRVGVLADLYAIAQVAYVGGGFHGAGLHSVIEPAALGVPVIFGPRHGNAREADELAGKGGGFVASDGPAFANYLLDLTARPAHRRTASEAARSFVAAKLGGARRNAELIAGLVAR